MVGKLLNALDEWIAPRCWVYQVLDLVQLQGGFMYSDIACCKHFLFFFKKNTLALIQVSDWQQDSKPISREHNA